MSAIDKFLNDEQVDIRELKKEILVMHLELVNCRERANYLVVLRKQIDDLRTVLDKALWITKSN